MATTTIEHCFSASQIKLHGPYQPAASLIKATEIEDEILDCIRVVHPEIAFNREQLNALFINSRSEIVDDEDDDIEARIIDTYTPAEIEDPATEPAPPPPVSHHDALQALEMLLQYSLQFPQNTQQLEHDLYREKRQIEAYLHQEKAKQTQRRITDYLQPS